MKRAVMGIVPNQNQAEYVVGQLQHAGLSNNDISVVFPDQQRSRDFVASHDTSAPEGAFAGAGAGGLVGGTLGVLVGIGALAIPGLGPLIAAGPLLATLSGAAAGATLGGVTGALVGLGIPEIEAKRYEGKLRSGNVLVAVHTEDREQQELAERIYKMARAENVFSTSGASTPASVREPQRFT